MIKNRKVHDRPISVWKRLNAILHLIRTICISAPQQHPSRIDFSGARNFRDLRGYPAIDGRQIKKGLLYRSDNLSDLSNEDLEVLSSLGLRRIYDLRNEDEQKANPNTLPQGSSIQLIGLPFAYEALDTAVMQKRVLSGDLEKGEAKRIMIDSYRTYVIDYREQLSVILRGLTEPGTLPALIHCVHGKDRTGLVVSTILEALRIPRDIIRDDYLLSNTFWESETRRLSFLAYLASIFRTPTKEVRSLMEALPEYLDAAEQAMDEQFGSMDNYLHEGLGLDEATIERLRDALLE